MMDANRTHGACPEVSVIVPVFNGAGTIEECLHSLGALRPVGGGMEVCVVDNGSTDGTTEILRRMGDAIRLAHEPKRGAAAARNHGVRMARGRFMAFTDADCVVEPDWLVNLVAPLSDERVGISGGRILSRIGANRIERFGERIHDHHIAITRDDNPYVISMNWASPRAVLEEAGLFDESLLRGQDVDLAWRIRQLGYRLAYCPDAVVRHRNERTIWGLINEGWVHGRAGVRIRAKHRDFLHGSPTQRPALRARLSRVLRAARGAEQPLDRLLWLLFESGRMVGELSMEADDRASTQDTGRMSTRTVTL